MAETNGWEKQESKQFILAASKISVSCDEMSVLLLKAVARKKHIEGKRKTAHLKVAREREIEGGGGEGEERGRRRGEG